MNLRILLVAAALLSGCGGIPVKQRDQEQLERYLQYAGEPVDHFTYLGRYDSWQELAPYQLMVWTTVDQAYLITVVPPCPELQFANRVGLTATQHTVYVRLDSVLVRGWRCQISEIRPVDYRRMRQDLRREHGEQQGEQARER